MTFPTPFSAICCPGPVGPSWARFRARGMSARRNPGLAPTGQWRLVDHADKGGPDGVDHRPRPVALALMSQSEVSEIVAGSDHDVRRAGQDCPGPRHPPPADARPHDRPSADPDISIDIVGNWLLVRIRFDEQESEVTLGCLDTSDERLGPEVLFAEHILPVLGPSL